MTSVDLQKVLLSQEDASSMHAAQALSACIDGQANARELDLDDPSLIRRWAHYHLIGDVLKDPSSLTPVSESFAVRMSAALAREAAHGQQAVNTQTEHLERPSFWQRATMAWPGLAVASAVASVVWIAQPLLELQQGSGQPVVIQEMAAPPSTGQVSGNTPMADYVSAHRHMAGPIAPRHVAFTPGGQ